MVLCCQAGFRGAPSGRSERFVKAANDPTDQIAYAAPILFTSGVGLLDPFFDGVASGQRLPHNGESLGAKLCAPDHQHRSAPGCADVLAVDQFLIQHPTQHSYEVFLIDWRAEKLFRPAAIDVVYHAGGFFKF